MASSPICAIFSGQPGGVLVAVAIVRGSGGDLAAAVAWNRITRDTSVCKFKSHKKIILGAHQVKVEEAHQVKAAEEDGRFLAWIALRDNR